MTQFLAKSFSVSEKQALTPEEEKERQRAWAKTFPSYCQPCAELDWAQSPMRNKACPSCSAFFCAEHLAEHHCKGPA